MFNLNNTFSLFIKRESLVVITLAAISLISFWVAYSNDWILIHTDAVGHLNTARKVGLGTPSGLGQLGGIWLPLQHLLLLPLVFFDLLYYTGIAGSIISMVSYLVASFFLYKLIYKFTKSFLASVIGTSVFALNPNILLYQAAPMLELLFFATTIVGIYFFSLWEEKGKYLDLAAAAFFLLLASTTRFEAWPIILFLSLVIAIKTFLKKKNFNFTQAHLVYFLTIVGGGVAVWLVFLAAIFGDPLFFVQSIYSPSAYVEAARFGQIGGVNLVSGVGQIIKMVFDVMVANSGIAAIYTGVLGFVVFLLNKRFKNLAPYSLLIPAAFYVFLVYTGQLLIFFNESESYQVRYGMFVLLPIGLFVGYLVNWRKIFAIWVIGLILTSYGLMATENNVATFNEAKESFVMNSRESSLKESAHWLKENYSGGRILMALFLNEEVMFYSRITTREFIHEGSQDLFKKALKNPEHEVDWVITGVDNNNVLTDIVNKEINKKNLNKFFHLRYEDDYTRIYDLVDSKVVSK